MAAIGDGWAADAWVEPGWVTGAWLVGDLFLRFLRPFRGLDVIKAGGGLGDSKVFFNILPLAVEGIGGIYPRIRRRRRR